MADQTKIILYKQSDGTLAYLIPSPNCTMTIDEIAQKDVPTGYSYKIINKTDMPTDRTFRDAWTIADSELTDGVGSTEGNTLI